MSHVTRTGDNRAWRCLLLFLSAGAWAFSEKKAPLSAPALNVPSRWTCSWQMVFVSDTCSQQRWAQGNDHRELSAESPNQPDGTCSVVVYTCWRMAFTPPSLGSTSKWGVNHSSLLAHTLLKPVNNWKHNSRGSITWYYCHGIIFCLKVYATTHTTVCSGIWNCKTLKPTLLKKMLITVIVNAVLRKISQPLNGLTLQK